jgi:ATP-binding cassette, subfamily B, multidrug efflux pump
MYTYFEKLLDAFPASAPIRANATLSQFLWQSMAGSRLYFVGLVLFSGLIAAFEAILFALMGSVVDWLASSKPDQLWTNHKQGFIWLIVILIASILAITMQTLLKHQTLYGNFPMRLRWNFHRWMLSQSLGFYQDEFAGRVSTKVMQTALATRDLLMSITEMLVYVVVYVGTMIGMVGSFHPLLLVPFFVWLIAYGLLSAWFVPKIGEIGKQQADARSLMTGRVTDAYANISTVKLFSHHEREAQFARESMQEFMGTAYPQMRLSSSFEIFNHILAILLISSTCGLVIWLWTQGQVALGAVAAACAMAIRLQGISHWIMWELAGLFEHIGTVRDGMAMLSQSLSIVDQPNAKPLVVAKGEIKFEDVNFGYTKERQVVHNLNLIIRPGEKVALVGPSGAGKSTITNLLLRLYDVQGGRVLIDGQNVNAVTQRSVQANVGMVTQDTSLLHRSLRDNLCYGNPDATEEQIKSAAHQARADVFIEQMRDGSGRTGLEAHVGERGVKLSGGQRQRVAIARVILKDAPILVLDEATSALDSEIEAAIQESLYRLMEGKTVLAIAHRLSTIAAMDRLIVMDQGRIVEQGSHQQLLAAGGLYARLWARQSGGFLGEVADA